MLISFSKKFIFIHNSKSAGTSIRKALIKYQPLYRNILTFSSKPYKYIIINIVKNMPENFKNQHIRTLQIPHHANALEIKKNLSNDNLFNDFFKFGFVRNPWDREVSNYFYILNNWKHPAHKKIKNFLNFDEYLEWRVKQNKIIQKDLFSDKNGNVIVDFIGKLENLNNDFNFVLKKLDLPINELPHKNKSSHFNYRKYYNNYSKSLIEENFKTDIEFFNYEF